MTIGDYTIRAELKNCPFCGRGIDEVKVIRIANERRYFVKCKCGIETNDYASKQCAVKKWNKRKEV